MKKIIALLVLLLCLSAYSIERYETTDAYGTYKKNQVDVVSCLYAFGEETYPSGRTVFKVYINSDAESGMNFSFELPNEIELPLQNGMEYEKRDVTISYNDGVLRYVSNSKSDLYYGFSRDIEILEIEVDEYLQNPKRVYGHEYTKRYTLPKVEHEELTCQF